MTKLRVWQYSTAIAVVGSERSARRIARDVLGSKSLVETPTENGWQYWRPTDHDESDDVVTIEVVP